MMAHRRQEKPLPIVNFVSIVKKEILERLNIGSDPPKNSSRLTKTTLSDVIGESSSLRYVFTGTKFTTQKGCSM